jgi:hypothetical protein
MMSEFIIMDEEVKRGFVGSLGEDFKNLSENELDALLSETLNGMTESQAEGLLDTLKKLGQQILSSLPNIVQGAAAGGAIGGLPGAAVGAVAGGLSATQQKPPSGAAAPTTPAAAPTTPAAAPTTPAAAPTTPAAAPTTPAAAPTTPAAAPTTPAANDYPAEAAPPVAPSSVTTTQPSSRPGYIWVVGQWVNGRWVSGHWERAPASSQPSYPPSQPSYPPSQPSYPPSQPSYPPSQPSYPYPYPPSQPSYPYPYPPSQPSYPYPYPPSQPSYPYDYDYGQTPYAPPGTIPYTETSTPTTGTPTTAPNARAAALDILEIIKNPKFLQVLAAAILGPKGKKEIEIAGKNLPLGTIFNLLGNLSSTASTGTASTAPSNLETYIESTGRDIGNVYDVDNAIMDLIRQDNTSAREAISPNSNNIESSYSLPGDDAVIELD